MTRMMTAPGKDEWESKNGEQLPQWVRLAVLIGIGVLAMVPALGQLPGAA
jgi:hypothetical protein